MSLETVTIADSASGTSARVLPELGFNCYSFSVATPSGPLEALWSEAAFTGGKTKPTRSGIPLLFPFAGRIRGTSFRFEGRDYQLEAGDGQGNAIHGFVFNRPWRVVEKAADRVAGQFQASVDDASLLARWPADFRITVSYQVAGNALSIDFVVENPDERPLPFGLGMHPYFRVPLGGDSADACRVTVPVGSSWELADLVPTGRATHTPLCEEISRGMAVGEMQCDNVFGGLKFEGQQLTTTIHDPGSGRTLSQTFGNQFTACVVFNPPHREAVAIEPYTTIPDPFSLREKGVDANLKIVSSGESFRARVEIRVD